MKQDKSSLLKTVRTEKEISQKDIAEKLGISRPSYIALEKGERSLSLAEAEILSDILGVSIDDLLEKSVPNDAKYMQMIFAFLKQHPSRYPSGTPKTKLAKLLYLADFAWYYDNLVSMSHMRYRRIQYGPVPDAYFRIIDELYNDGTVDIEKKEDGAMLISLTASGKRKPTDLLSKKEKLLIEKIAKKWKHKRTQEIVDFTHDQLPYALSAEKEIIPYQLIIQEDPGYVY